ncbi:hypothetical protein NP233_g10352 [Leucocoprinus birnbaumii]|uniref:RING-type domain-containing protein n=1 Tax=Leucocoprinus birnbaumii TaxID=56174 RepID=A0AAD5VIG9_9AGAR|nr:hypothetical protein NP233_g10352 [Leucocoprinus birnbaumii]
MSCCICLEDLDSPVSLPCGHVFCQECLKRAVQAIQPYSTLHACPTCRSHYFITPLDITTVPPHLRPHVTPSIRRVYLDLPTKAKKNSYASTSKESSPELSRTLSTEVARLRAEVEALRHNCSLWRRRAEVHSSATVGLLELSKTARDQIIQTCRERDTIQRDYYKLNHDFKRQQAILQALVSNGSMPQQRFGSPSNLQEPQPLIDQSTSRPKVLATTPQRLSGPMESQSRKRLRSEDEDGDSASAAYPSRPIKIPRRLETGSLDESGTRSTVAQLRTETS